MIVFVTFANPLEINYTNTAHTLFREVREVSLQTLALGPHARTLNDLAYAKQVLGEVQDALDHYTTAMSLYQEIGDQAGLAATLTRIGAVYDGLGDRQQALSYYHQALPITEEVGDRAGESVTRYNMAMIYRSQGQLMEAVAALRQVVELDQQVQHPDLECPLPFAWFCSYLAPCPSIPLGRFPFSALFTLGHLGIPWRVVPPSTLRSHCHPSEVQRHASAPEPLFRGVLNRQGGINPFS